VVLTNSVTLQEDAFKELIVISQPQSVNLNDEDLEVITTTPQLD